MQMSQPAIPFAMQQIGLQLMNDDTAELTGMANCPVAQRRPEAPTFALKNMVATQDHCLHRRTPTPACHCLWDDG